MKSNNELRVSLSNHSMKLEMQFLTLSFHQSTNSKMARVHFVIGKRSRSLQKLLSRTIHWYRAQWVSVFVPTLRVCYTRYTVLLSSFPSSHDPFFFHCPLFARSRCPRFLPPTRLLLPRRVRNSRVSRQDT